MYEYLERIQVLDRTLTVYSHRPKSLHEILVQTANRYPDRTAIIFNDKHISYRELQWRADRIARHFIHTLKLKKGDRIALLFPNTPAFCELLLAAAKTGVIAVLLNCRLTPSELKYMIGHSGCRMIFYDTGFGDKAEQLREQFIDIDFIKAGSAIESPDEMFVQSQISDNDMASVDEEAVDELDPCYIMYTSGTTGKPKGALTLNMNVIHSAINYHKICGTTIRDITLIAVPLFHVTGLIGQFVHMLLAGGTSVLLREYSTDAFIKTVIRHRVTFMFNVPAIYNLLLLREESVQIDGLRLALYGGAPMSPESILKLQTLFPGLILCNAYGATETSSPASLMPIGWPMEKVGSVGRPVPGAACKVMDEGGKECTPEEVGELWISGAMVIPEYWQNEEANRSSFEKGYWKSGDMAKIDTDGYVYIMDRKKDMINRGGEKIYTVEIEHLLYSHPKVLEAAVVGVPDDIFGEQVKAFVVVKESNTLTEDEIKEFVKLSLADFKVPRHIQFVDLIPRNPGGKIMKQLLREQSNNGGGSKMLDGKAN